MDILVQVGIPSVLVLLIAALVVSESVWQTVIVLAQNKCSLCNKLQSIVVNKLYLNLSLSIYISILALPCYCVLSVMTLWRVIVYLFCVRGVSCSFILLLLFIGIAVLYICIPVYSIKSVLWSYIFSFILFYYKDKVPFKGVTSCEIITVKLINSLTATKAHAIDTI